MTNQDQSTLHQQQRIKLAEFEEWTEIDTRIKCQSGKQLLSSSSYLGGIPPNPNPDIDWEIHSEELPDYHNDRDAIVRVMLKLDKTKRHIFYRLLHTAVESSIKGPRNFLTTDFHILTAPNDLLVELACEVID